MKVAGSDVHLHRNRQLFVSHPRLLKAMEGAYERENWHLPSKNNIKIWECCLFDSKNQKSRRNKRVPLTVYLNRIFFFSINEREGRNTDFFLIIYLLCFRFLCVVKLVMNDIMRSRLFDKEEGKSQMQCCYHQRVTRGSRVSRERKILDYHIRQMESVFKFCVIYIFFINLQTKKK